MTRVFLLRNVPFNEEYKIDSEGFRCGLRKTGQRFMDCYSVEETNGVLKWHVKQGSSPAWRPAEDSFSVNSF